MRRSSLVLGLVLGLLPSPGPGARADGAADTDRALVELARGALARGEPALARRVLRAWATLRPRSAPPDGTGEVGLEALRFAGDAGTLGVAVSREAGRVRVRLRDPAGVVDGVELRVDGPDGRSPPLPRREGGAYEALEYSLAPSAAGVALEVRLRADALGLVAPLLVVRVEPGAVPAPPPPPRAERSSPEPVAGPASGLAWWVVAVGVAAVGLAGAALVLDLRDAR